jgi:hypothetical protein
MIYIIPYILHVLGENNLNPTSNLLYAINGNSKNSHIYSNLFWKNIMKTPKYHTSEHFSKSNRKVVEKGKFDTPYTHIHNHCLSRIDTDTSIKRKHYAFTPFMALPSGNQGLFDNDLTAWLTGLTNSSSDPWCSSRPS